MEIVTEELVRRLETVGVEFIAGWCSDIPGVRVERFGDARASLNPDEPELDFQNMVMGLYPNDAGKVDPILRFYADAGVRPWFELPPASEPARLSIPLGDAGARPIGFSSMLYGSPKRLDADARVREARPDEAPVFADVLLRGHGAPDEASREHIVRWAQAETSRMFVAQVDGEVAAAAALHYSGGIAYLANASTLPEARGLGLQTALIAARMIAAAEAGSDLVSSQATWSSQSQRNLERAGLSIAYTKTIWRVQA
ncbi:MAG: GNAT family N-acetyltransferase [Actinomycetota bacterium]|nr:GNAT family N-acetyltransferase [Actinomycetota bacterium]